MKVIRREDERREGVKRSGRKNERGEEERTKSNIEWIRIVE